MLKLISLNIEGDNHLDKVIPFLQKERADVVCLQEVLEKDVDRIKNDLGIHGMYVPSMYIQQENTVRLSPHTQCGILFLTKTQPLRIYDEWYVGTKASLPHFTGDKPNANNRVIVIGEIMQENTLFRVITTHFTWSDEGQTTPLQREDLEKLFKLLEAKDHFVLCGDFNAPRGREIWGEIAARYTDNIPSHVATTIDPNLHRVKNLPYVVDGMFSTPGYTISDVKVIPRVSDHQAIIGTISHTP